MTYYMVAFKAPSKGSELAGRICHWTIDRLEVSERPWEMITISNFGSDEEAVNKQALAQYVAALAGTEIKVWNLGDQLPSTSGLALRAMFDRFFEDGTNWGDAYDAHQRAAYNDVWDFFQTREVKRVNLLELPRPEQV